MARWWLSFATDEKNLGCCIVEADDLKAAHKRATALGINPGGEMMGVGYPDTPEADADVELYGMNRLIPLEELIRNNGARMGDHPGLDEYIMDNFPGGYVCEEHNS